MNPNINTLHNRIRTMYAAPFIGGSGVLCACDPGGFRHI